MGYKTKSMINQASGLDVNYKLKQELNKYTDSNPKKNKVSTTNKKTPTVGVSGFGDRKGGFGSKIIPTSFNGKITTTSNLLPTSSPKENSDKKQSDKAYKKQAKSIGTYINKGGERGYKKSQRKEARAVGKEAAKNVDTSFKKAELAGTDFNSLLIGTIQNISASSKASSKKRKVKRAARKEHKEFQKKGSSSLDGKGLTEGFKGADLPKIDSGIKTGDFFQNTFNKFNPDRDKSIKKQASDKIKEKKSNELAPQEVFKEQVKPMYDFGPLAPKSNNTDMNKSFGQQVYKDFTKMGDDAKRILTREASQEMEKKQRALSYLDKQDASGSGQYSKQKREVGQQFTKDRAFAEKLLRTGTNNPFSVSQDVVDKFDANLKTGQNKKELQAKSIEDAKRIAGVPMLGDGFNKGMLRKNKYKK